MHKLLKRKIEITRGTGGAVIEVEREIEFERQNNMNRIQGSGSHTEGLSRIIEGLK